MTGGVGGLQGSLAQFASVDADLLAIKPGNLGMREAAALPLIFITAWEGLVDRAAVHAGQKVLVHGGAGGVGHIAVQIARAFGAEVFATGSAASRPSSRGSARSPIDYRATPVEHYVADIQRRPRLRPRLRHRRRRDARRLVQRGPPFRPCRQRARLGHACAGAAVVPRRQLFGRVHAAADADRRRPRASRRDLARGDRLVEAGKVVPRVDPRRFGLSSVGDAYRAVEAGEAWHVVVDIG